MIKEEKKIPRLSIVIACYNDLFVVEAVKSAFAQTYINKEIIVVNDGSNAETKLAIKSVSKFIDTIIDQENSGQSAARNKGISKASGTYILNLDSDDFFEPDFAEKAIQRFEEDHTIRIVTCKARRFNMEGEIDVFTPSGGSLNNFLFSNSALGSSMFKKKDWEICGGYEEKLPILGFEDWEFYIQILKSGGYAYVINEVLFNYRVRENSTTSKIKNIKQDKFKTIILKHKDLYKYNFDALIEDLFYRIKKEEKDKLRIKQKIDFRTGNMILKPLRKIKNIFKSF